MHTSPPAPGVALRGARVTLALLLLTAMFSLVLPTPTAEAAVVRPFASVFSAQTNGSIAITGNSMMSCGGASGCAAALAGTTPRNNNDFAMSFIDRDSDASTTRSSSADVTIPSGARVLYAGLFWGAARTAGQSGAAASGRVDQIKLRAPGATGYSTVTAGRTDNLGGANNDYSAYADVTQQVAQAGSGTYFAADMAAATGVDRYAGWSLVVAVQDPTAPLRDLNVFNGYASATGNETVDATIGPFRTPPTGPVNARFGTVTYEGDANITGDFLAVNGTRLADAQSPSANFFGSRITAGGANLTNRNPASVNNLGIDAKVIDAPGVIPNSPTSETTANVRFNTSGDFYYPAALTTQVDLYAPVIRGTKTVQNRSGSGTTRVGDTLEYTMTYSNTGDDTATGAVITDQLPAGTTFVPGSLAVVAGASGTLAKTDAADADEAEYDAATRTARFRVGTGATATTGGRLASGASVTVRLRVTVDESASGTTLANSSSLAYGSLSAPGGRTYSYDTAAATTAVSERADLSLTKVGTPSEVNAGGNETYTLTTTNAGPNDAADVQVVDTLPEGVELVSATVPGGTCTPSGRAVTCGLGTVASGASRAVEIVVAVPSGSQATSLTNVATVSSTTSDPDPANNNASATTAVTRSADVSITKTADDATRTPGQPVGFTLRATNSGPSTATGVVVSDTLPLGLEEVSTSAPAGVTCTTVSRAVTCNAPRLERGASVAIRVEARLSPSFTGASLTNVASVRSDLADPAQANNSASARIEVAAPSADLGVTKQLVGPAVPGRPVQYLVTVTNSGPSDATQVALRDVLPASLSGVRATPTAGTCDVTAGTLTCGLETLPVGASTQVTIDANLDPDTTGDLVNVATVESATADPQAANNTGRSAEPVAPQADLAVAKSASPAVVDAGERATYTLTATNNGPSTAREVVLTDTVQAPLVFVSASSGCTASGTPVTVRCAVGDVPAGASRSVEVVADVPASTPPDQRVENTATVGSATPDPNGTNDSTVYVLPLGAEADLTIAKTATPATATAGAPITYRLTATNNGPSDATGVRLTDAVPGAVTVSSITADRPGSSCVTAAGPDVDCTTPTLPSGESFTVTVSGTVASTATAANLRNTARLSAQTPDDPTADNNTVTLLTPLQRSADLAIDASGPATALAGEQVSWTLRASNSGPSAVDDATVTVTDTLPAGVTFVSANVAGGGACDFDGRQVRCTGLSLASGAALDIVVVGRIDPGLLPTTLTNSVSISSNVPDPTPENNVDTTDVVVDSATDLVLTKVAEPGEFVAGATGRYVLTVANRGPSSARDVVVTDTMPAGLTVQSATFDGGECAVDGQEVRCTRERLPGDASAQVVLDVTVDPSLEATTVTNSAAATSQTRELDGPNLASVDVDVVEQADLQVIAAADQQTVTAGAGLTYTFTVINNGPSDAEGSTLDLSVPTSMNLTGTVSTTAGDCTVVGRTLSCDFGTLAPGAPVTVTLPAVVVTTASPGSIGVTASVATTSPDGTPANDSSTVAIDVVTSADLSLQKSANPEQLVPGERVQYTLLVQNAGPSLARQVLVTDTVPAAISGVTATLGGAGGSCTVTGREVRCDLGDVRLGQVAVTIEGILAAGYEGLTLSNTGVVTSATDDPDTDDTRSTIDSVVVPQADMQIAKTLVDPETDQPTTEVPAAGERVKFRLRVTNEGPSTARSPQFIDQLPPGLVDVVVTPPRLPNGGPVVASCETVAPVDPGTADNPNAPTIFCSGPLFRTTAEIGGIDGFVEATIAPGFEGQLTNTARISADTIDPVSTNNESSVDLTIAGAADLSLDKALVSGPPVPGEDVEYTLTVDNDGPSTARGVVVDDAVPSELTDVTATASDGSTCTVGADNAVSCDLGTLTVSDPPVTVTVTGGLPADFVGTLSNTATVASATGDPEDRDNTDTVAREAEPEADLAVDKALSPAVPVPGEPVTYAVTVTNTGPSVAREVEVLDAVPAALTGVAATSDDADCAVLANQVTCDLGDVAPGADPVQVTITGDLPADFEGRLSNTATVDSETPDPDATDNEGAADGDTAGSADVAVTKTLTSGTPVPGETVSYLITVGNEGPSTARGVTLTDMVPAALQQVTFSPTAGCGLADRTLTCDVGTLEPGQDPVEVSVSGTLAAGFTGTLSNTAAATTTTADPDSGNNDATATAEAEPSADVSVVKTMAPAAPVPGEDVVFTLTVDNAGPSTARGVSLRDEVPDVLGDLTVTSDDGVTCSVAANVVLCPVGDLAVGAPVEVVVTGSLPEDFTGTLSNTATVTAATADPDGSDNTDTVSGIARPLADLEVTKSLEPAAPRPGQPVTFTVAVTNQGPSTATGVEVTDELGDELLDPAATADAGGSCTLVGQLVGCSFAELPNGATGTVTITATLDPDFGGRLSNTAEATAITDDPDPGNNADTALAGSPICPPGTDPALGCADLQLTKTASTNQAAPGDLVRFALVTTNNGPSSARDVVVTDELPAGLRLVGVTRSDGEACSTTAQSVRCEMGRLLPDASVTVEVTTRLGRAVTAGSITNNAVASTGSDDPVAANDGDRATVAVSPASGGGDGGTGPGAGGPGAGDGTGVGTGTGVDTIGGTDAMPDTGAAPQLRALLVLGLASLGLGAVLVRRRRLPA